VQFYNYEEKYASNPVIDFLRDKPHERRVIVFPLNFGPDFGMFQQFYNIEWLQQHFVYYNIQSLDYPQDPRPPKDKAAFERAMLPAREDMEGTKDRLLRYWQVTNTRLMFAPAGSAAQINRLLDPEKQRFNQLFAFQLVQRGDQLFGAQTNTTGPFALLEFTGALPRAKLYGRWESGREDNDVLKLLTTPAFDPETTVLVADPLPAPVVPKANLGTVTIMRHGPKKVVLQANASAPAVLVLNDRYDPNWRVTIDGQPAPLLRCNFIMRGVSLLESELGGTCLLAAARLRHRHRPRHDRKARLHPAVQSGPTAPNA
jgi:hypothetical protein